MKRVFENLFYAACVAGFGFIGFLFWGLVSGWLFKNPEVYFDVHGLMLVWHRVLYAAGMIGVGGTCCGGICGLGIGVGEALKNKKYLAALPMGLLFGLGIGVCVGLAGAVISFFPGILYILVLGKYLLGSVLGLYVLAFATSGWLFGMGLLHGKY